MKVNYELYTFTIRPRCEFDFRPVARGDKRPFIILALTEEGSSKYRAAMKSRFDFFFVRNNSEMPLEDFPTITDAMLWLQSDLEERIGLYQEAERLKRQLEDQKKQRIEAQKKALRLIGINWRVR